MKISIPPLPSPRRQWLLTSLVIAFLFGCSGNLSAGKKWDAIKRCLPCFPSRERADSAPAHSSNDPVNPQYDTVPPVSENSLPSGEAADASAQHSSNRQGPPKPPKNRVPRDAAPDPGDSPARQDRLKAGPPPVQSAPEAARLNVFKRPNQQKSNNNGTAGQRKPRAQNGQIPGQYNNVGLVRKPQYNDPDLAPLSEYEPTSAPLAQHEYEQVSIVRNPPPANYDAPNMMENPESDGQESSEE